MAATTKKAAPKAKAKPAPKAAAKPAVKKATPPAPAAKGTNHKVSGTLKPTRRG
jgi:hypothetical protein